MKKELQVGDVFELKSGMRVYWEHDGYSSDELEINQKTSGLYVVINTAFEGGGTGMGDHDVYPDGHCVYAKKLKAGVWDKNGKEVYFYQSGSFTCILEPEKIEKVIKVMQMSFK